MRNDESPKQSKINRKKMRILLFTIIKMVSIH